MTIGVYFASSQTGQQRRLDVETPPACKELSTNTDRQLLSFLLRQQIKMLTIWLYWPWTWYIWKCWIISAGCWGAATSCHTGTGRTATWGGQVSGGHVSLAFSGPGDVVTWLSVKSDFQHPNWSVIKFSICILWLLTPHFLSSCVGNCRSTLQPDFFSNTMIIAQIQTLWSAIFNLQDSFSQLHHYNDKMFQMFRIFWILKFLYPFCHIPNFLRPLIILFANCIECGECFVKT